MSPVASRITPSIVGNTARALEPLSGDPELIPDALPGKGGARKNRTPLSLVVSTPRRSRAPFVAIFFTLLVAALATVLIINVSVSQGQYKLVALKDQQTALMKSNQALEQKIGSQQAPQNLVARAKDLGMVPAGTTGQIDVRTKRVSGNPQPAVAGTKGLAIIAPPSIDNTTDGDAVVPPPAAEPTVPKAAPQEPLAPAPAAATAELNGGTIPAPAQKAG